MKKFFFFITLLICLGFPSLSFAQWTGSIGGGTWKPGGGIIINVEPKFPLPGTGGRSVDIQTVEAWVDFDMGQIEVAFAKPVGKAVVAVENAMGQVISSYTCDTSAEWLVYLPIPNAKGCYKLTVYSPEFGGEGLFEL